MTTFAERITSVDTPLVNDNAATTPAIWWLNGSKQAKTPGMFYLKDNVLQQQPTEPWTPSQRFDNEQGFAATTLHLAPITWRQQPYLTVETVIGGEKRKDRRYIAEWEPGAQLHTEIVCLAEGIAEPVVWSFHGMTGRAVMGKNGILAQHRNGLLRQAEQLAGKQLPLWTLWLPVTTLQNAKGQPVYTDTGHGSFVTLPTLALPKETEAQLVEALFVGEEWVAYGYDVRRQFDVWRTQRRGAGGTAKQHGHTNVTGSITTNGERPSDDQDNVPL